MAAACAQLRVRWGLENTPPHTHPAARPFKRVFFFSTTAWWEGRGVSVAPCRRGASAVPDAELDGGWEGGGGVSWAHVTPERLICSLSTRSAGQSSQGPGRWAPASRWAVRRRCLQVERPRECGGVGIPTGVRGTPPLRKCVQDGLLWLSTAGWGCSR